MPVDRDSLAFLFDISSAAGSLAFLIDISSAAGEDVSRTPPLEYLVKTAYEYLEDTIALYEAFLKKRYICTLASDLLLYKASDPLSYNTYSGTSIIKALERFESLEKIAASGSEPEEQISCYLKYWIHYWKTIRRASECYSEALRVIKIRIPEITASTEAERESLKFQENRGREEVENTIRYKRNLSDRELLLSTGFLIDAAKRMRKAAGLLEEEVGPSLEDYLFGENLTVWKSLSDQSNHAITEKENLKEIVKAMKPLVRKIQESMKETEKKIERFLEFREKSLAEMGKTRR